MTTEIMIPQKPELDVMFRSENGADQIIEKIKGIADKHSPDISTSSGRKAIASLAYKIAQSKTALDNAGKLLNEDARKQIAVVDAERRKIREQLDELRDQVRKPLTDWEDAEKARVSALESRLDRLRKCEPDDDTTASISRLIGRVEVTAIDDSWSEYVAMAAQAKDATLSRLRGMLAVTKQREDQEAEIARLRAEAEAREEADRLAKIERDKQESARLAAQEAEERAKVEADRAAQEAAEREASLARELAESKAREEAAAQAERDRLDAERKAAADARVKRQADQAHRARIQSEIAAAIEAYEGMGAMGIADAIIGGAIPHVTVNF